MKTKRLLCLGLLLVLLVLASPTLADMAEYPFTVDVSAMPAPAQEAWAALFRDRNMPSYRGNPNDGLAALPDNKGRIAGHFQKHAVFRITGDEPVAFLMYDREVFSTAVNRPEGHIVIGYFTIPEEDECTVVNTETAFRTGIYPVVDIMEHRHYYDEYRYWASHLLLPVKENHEQAYRAIDVVFQSDDRVTYHGRIVVNEARLLVMRPVGQAVRNKQEVLSAAEQTVRNKQGRLSAAEQTVRNK